MKALAKAALLNVYKYSGAMAIQERIAYQTGSSILPILLFHRVTDEIPPDGLTVPTSWFSDLCELLRQRFHVVSLARAVQYLESGERIPWRTIAITFDDCYHDNLWAARELANHELPACFFIPTAYPGTDYQFPWDRGLKRMANLSWGDIRAMADMGHEIGSHTVHHVDMAQVSLDEARHELIDSRNTLEKQLDRPVPWFAYPYGRRSNFAVERLPLVREAGYRACFSGFGGFVRPEMKGQIIPRVPVPCFRSLLNLELHLTGCLSWFYTLKQRVGMI